MMNRTPSRIIRRRVSAGHPETLNEGDQTLLNRSTLIATGAAGLTALLLGAAAAPGFIARAAACPGKIVCPLTGELVCRDQCPRVDPNRPQCPGQIECAATGALICADRCPFEDAATTATPACCANKSAV